MTANQPKWTVRDEDQVYWQDWRYHLQPTPWCWSKKLTGLYLVSMAGMRIPGKSLTQCLPKGLELDPAAATPDGEYFVAVGFGRQISVRFAWVPRVISFNYRELVSGISGVRLKNRPELGTFTYMAGLFVDNWVALLLGRLLGYPKFMSRIDIQTQGDANTQTSDPLGVKVIGYHVALAAAGAIRGVFTALGQEVTPPDGPEFDYYRRFFAQPVISRNMFGRLIMYNFNFHFESAVAQPVDMTVVLDHAIPGLPIGSGGLSAIRSDNPLGGCKMLLNWTLSPAKKGGKAFPPPPAPTVAPADKCPHCGK